ncbi:hypothetical protein UlMin_017677 [Ulmus minor]
MATYFNHGSSEIQSPDGLHTLYLMNPNYVQTYNSSDPQINHQQPNNMLLLNPETAAAAASRHFLALPLPPAAMSHNLSDHEIPTLHGVAASRFHYNLWPPPDQTAAGIDSGDAAADTIGFRRHVVSPNQQGLSLSLSSQQTTGYNEVVPASTTAADNPRAFLGNSPPSVSAVSNGIGGLQSVLSGSKYLKVAQELLDEVVNVGKEIKLSSTAEGSKDKATKTTPAAAIGTSCDNSGGESSSRQVAELSTAQRQDLQVKKAKLATMLDEVEHRYRQYHQQMQMVTNLFEQAAGFGSAKSYTALALKTISKQFRCLKDAISGQIKATTKSLGEEEQCLGVKIEGSRLRFVDHQLRQQRALQQLGMIQHNAWRPQRGLPERAVSVLRAWLFEHFLHPYPKTSDKVMLAKQTGLTRSQVSNWFINARVRLWKPMVEEMYVEETKGKERNGDHQGNNKTEPNKDSASCSTTPHDQTTKLDDDDHQTIALNTNHHPNFITNQLQNHSPTEQISNSSVSATTGFNIVGLSTEIQARSPKKHMNNNAAPSDQLYNSPSSILSNEIDMKGNHERQTREGYQLINDNITSPNGGFGTYPIGNLGRFHVPHEQLAPRFHGNGVSLTLGLPHFDNNNNNNQQSYLSNQNSLHLGTPEADQYCAINTPQSSHSTTAAGNYDHQNFDMQSRKRFAAQLLHHFVA